MKQANSTKEDMFEKAREAFFGTVKTSPKVLAVRLVESHLTSRSHYSEQTGTEKEQR
jgi:hypothetical protein